jgi:hypothetical protein
LFAALASLVILVPAAPAIADSAGATIRSLPESTELHVHAEYHHECIGPPCSWFTEASAYSASTGCPAVFDATHSIWAGPVEKGEVTSRASFAFNPYGLQNEVVVCLYIWEEDESNLVGESHNFNRATGREVLPPQKLKPPPERHRRPVRYPNSELCKPLKAASGNLPGIWIMHLQGVHCPTARAVAKTVDRYTNPQRFTVLAAQGRWTCTREEVQGPVDPIGEVTCHRGGTVVVVGLGN